MADKLRSAMATSLALIEQFSSSLSAANETATLPSEDRSPLPLLSASATALKSQTTKLSLLALTVPFTPSAIASIMSTLNDSILPSLTTAALLTTTRKFTKSFEDEAHCLVRGIFSELQGLINAIQARSRADPSKEVNDAERATLTGLTGRVWEACDETVTLADKGLMGFVVKKAEQYKALVQDAVRELEEWDPSLDDEEDGFEDLLSDGEDGPVEKADDEDPERVLKLEVQKKTSLKVLSRIPQCIHVIIRNRLQKGLPSSPSDSQLRRLETLQSCFQSISETVDEAAGMLYENDADSANEFTHTAKALTQEAVELVLQVWENDEQGSMGVTKEDKYLQRAKEWIDKS